MTLHPSYGPMPPHIMQDAIQAPYGKACLIIREYDPLFGLRGSGKKLFKARVVRSVTRQDYACVELIADDEKQAQKQLHAKDWDRFDWSEGDEGDYDCEIENIEEMGP